MTCEELRDMYELYALGGLEETERREIDAHLGSGCQTCAQGLKRALETNAIVMSLAPAVAPPRRLRKKVLAAVGMEKTGWGWISGWATVTAGLLVAVLWLSMQDRRRAAELVDARRQVETLGVQANATAGQMAQLRDVVALLNAPETQLIGAGRGVLLPPKARVFVNPTRGVLLLVNNLRPAPPGRIYEMWLIPKGGAPRPAGLFQSDAAGNAVHLEARAIDVAQTAAVAVTIEPTEGSEAPTSTPFIVVSL